MVKKYIYTFGHNVRLGAKVWIFDCINGHVWLQYQYSIQQTTWMITKIMTLLTTFGMLKQIFSYHIHWS
jgi:hypothetical protein